MDKKWILLLDVLLDISSNGAIYNEKLAKDLGKLVELVGKEEKDKFAGKDKNPEENSY